VISKKSGRIKKFSYILPRLASNDC
jgi:hypothetical protein